jgi:hypothetical protein
LADSLPAREDEMRAKVLRQLHGATNGEGK